jgi:hypothetical protein
MHVILQAPRLYPVPWKIIPAEAERSPEQHPGPRSSKVPAAVGDTLE